MTGQKNSCQTGNEPYILSARNLSFGYSTEKALLNNVSFDLRKGQNIGLAGRNGSGKTSLFRCMTGLNKIWSGEIKLNGAAIKSEKDFISLRRKTGFSVQNAEDQIFFATALEDVAFGPLNLGLDQDASNERGRYWLAKVGMAGMENRQTAQLSGGQQKLLALAGILAMEPDALLLDEPFNGLDECSIENMALIISELPAAKIIVCHDSSLLRQISNEIWFLENGNLITSA